RLRKQSLTSSRRSHKKRALRQLCSYTCVFPRIMEKIYYVLQGFLGLILSGHIPERHAGLLFHIHLGIALADSHHAAALAHPPGHPDNHSYQKCDWQEG